MKPLNLSETTPVSDVKYDTIPAKLHDVSGQIYDDKLYCLYTLDTTVVDNEISIKILAADLVEHTAANGVKGYWVGIGINKELISVSEVYVGWGVPSEILTNPVQSDGEQQVGEDVYSTYYFNSATAPLHENKGYIVADKDGVRYHYDLDFSAITRMESKELLEPVMWSQVSTKELISSYLFGIDLTDPAGNPLPESLYVHYLNAAIDYLQNLLDITIGDTEFLSERHDYVRSDYRNWGYIQLFHNPVKEVKGLRMMYGNRPSMEIPLDWVQLNKLTGQITLFPQSGSANSLIIGQTGLLFGFQSQWDYAPSLWEVDYDAGIDIGDKNMPLTLLKEAIYKRTACGVLNVWGDLIIGAGIASQSVSIDGVSQSIGTTQSAMFGGASARTEAYGKDLEEVLLPALRQKLGGMRMIIV